MEPNPELSVWEGCDESITGGCVCQRDVPRGIFDCAGARRATVWCPVLWHGSAALPLDTPAEWALMPSLLRRPSWYIPRPDIKFCRVGCLKTYYFFLSIFNPRSMSLYFALSCIFYISSVLSPSPLNSIPVWPSAWAPQLLVCSHTNPLVYIGDAIKSKPSRGVPEREARVQARESNFNFSTHSPPFPISTHFHFPRHRSRLVLCSLSF